MAKQSVIEARKAQAAQDQAAALEKLTGQVEALGAKIDQLIDGLKPKAAKADKAEKGAA